MPRLPVAFSDAGGAFCQPFASDEFFGRRPNIVLETLRVSDHPTESVGIAFPILTRSFVIRRFFFDRGIADAAQLRVSIFPFEGVEDEAPLFQTSERSIEFAEDLVLRPGDAIAIFNPSDVQHISGWVDWRQ